MNQLLEQLRTIVGPQGWTSDLDTLQPHVTEWRGVFTGKTPLMVSPASTSEVSQVVAACARAGTGIVPQGGNTGMCAGGIPDESGAQILLSMSRMNRIRCIDADNFSMEVDAGCVLQSIQEAALDAGCYFPLSLGAEGSCQIGGNIATNAGGLNVVRYGTTRALVLGLEVVLADGTVLNSLRSLRKDTAGYDLKQLFIGSEGTLGIITGAALRLFPGPGALGTALVAIPSSATSVSLLGKLQAHFPDRVQTYELVSDYVFGLVERYIPDASLPIEGDYPWYVLLEVAIGDDEGRLEAALTEAVEDGLVLDAVIAKNSAEVENLWRLRHSISEAERQAGKALKHDISVPVSRMQEFLLRGDELLQKLRPDATLVAFGHVGDGNLHYNVSLPRDLDPDEYSRDGKKITTAIYDLVAELGGSFSAEHGVGQLKRPYLAEYRSGPEYDLMRMLKKTLDPANILNPGKVI
jgi:FAD/FMN-containing dehydrogenase